MRPGRARRFCAQSTASGNQLKSQNAIVALDARRIPSFDVLGVQVHVQHSPTNKALCQRPAGLRCLRLLEQFGGNDDIDHHLANAFRVEKRVLGIAHQRTGNIEAAQQSLLKAIELNPENAAAHQQLGILHREQGNFEASLNFYGQALQLDKDYALAHRNIGILYDLYLGERDKALQHFLRYQGLTGEADRTVAGWIADLERQQAMLARED